MYLRIKDIQPAVLSGDIIW